MRYHFEKEPSHIADPVTGQTTFIETFFLHDDTGVEIARFRQDGAGGITFVAAGEITDGNGVSLSSLSAVDVWNYKGATNCSTNPNYPAANAGDLYKVSVAGKIGGASGTVVTVGDIFVCNTDDTAAGTEAQRGTAWDHFPSASDIPVKATGAEVDTGTDDAKFATAKALADSGYVTEGASPSFADVNATGVYKVDGVQVVGSQLPHISTPDEGVVVDAECRQAVGNIINALVSHGLIGD